MAQKYKNITSAKHGDVDMPGVKSVTLGHKPRMTIDEALIIMAGACEENWQTDQVQKAIIVVNRYNLFKACEKVAREKM